MAWLFGGTGGGGFVSSTVTVQVYDPVFDTPMDPAAQMRLLPSFYRELLGDSEVLSTWIEGLQKMLVSDFVSLWTADYGKSLRDVPVFGQRKWRLLTFFQEPDFSEDPGVSYTHQAHLRWDTDRLIGTWQNRGRLDLAYLPLTGPFQENASFSFSVDVRITAADKRGVALFGYFSPDRRTFGDQVLERLASAIGAALVTPATESDAPRPGLFHVDAQGIPNVTLAAEAILLDEPYRLMVDYVARTGKLVLRTLRLQTPRVSGTGISGAADVDFTREFSDPEVNFDALGVLPGDVLRLGTEDHEIVSVAGSALLVRYPRIYPEASYAYTVYGSSEVSSVSLNLPAEVADATFSVRVFGTAPLDMRSASDQFFSGSGRAARQKIVGSTWNWRFVDPGFSESILALPRLQVQPLPEPSGALFEHLDYRVLPREGGCVVALQEPPSGNLWAEYVAYDEGTIRKNFGSLVGLSQASSDAYKAAVRGLFYSYYQGPTLESLRRGVHILLGLPIADVAGTVESVDLTYSGTLGILRVAGREYLFPLAVGTDLEAGDAVAIFEPLTRGVEVQDYLTHPEWFVGFGSMNEVEKYHSFLVTLSADVFNAETLAAAGSFVAQMKPTWKTARFRAERALLDEVSPQDALLFLPVLHALDSFYGEAPEVNYDDGELGGPGLDWRFDQGQTDWDAAAPSQFHLADRLPGTLTTTSGSATGTGAGTSFLSDLGGPGALSDVRLGLAVLHRGVTGRTAAGSAVFEDLAPGVFSGVSPGDTLTVPGEGDFSILALGTGTLTCDRPFASTASSVAWTVTARARTSVQATATTSNTSLTLGTPAPADGEYVLWLLDNRFQVPRYDAFQEMFPEEELVFTATLAPAYAGALPLPVTLPVSETSTVSLSFTNYAGAGPGDTVSSTLQEPA